jgi:hypothetical protein
MRHSSKACCAAWKLVPLKRSSTPLRPLAKRLRSNNNLTAAPHLQLATGHALHSRRTHFSLA